MADPSAHVSKLPLPNRSCAGCPGKSGRPLLSVRGRTQQARVPRTTLRQVQLDARAAQEECSHAEAQVRALEEQLEDASVAILGYQVDLVRERRRMQELESQENQLREQFAQLSRGGAEVGKSMTATCGQRHAEARSGHPSEDVEAHALLAQEVAQLEAAISGLELAIEEDEAMTASLRGEEMELEARHRDLTVRLRAAQEHLCWGLATHLDVDQTDDPGDSSRWGSLRMESPAEARADLGTCVQGASCNHQELQVDPSRVSLLPGYAALIRLPASLPFPLATERKHCRQLLR